MKSVIYNIENNGWVNIPWNKFITNNSLYLNLNKDLINKLDDYTPQQISNKIPSLINSEIINSILGLELLTLNKEYFYKTLELISHKNSVNINDICCKSFIINKNNKNWIYKLIYNIKKLNYNYYIFKSFNKNNNNSNNNNYQKNIYLI